MSRSTACRTPAWPAPGLAAVVLLLVAACGGPAPTPVPLQTLEPTRPRGEATGPIPTGPSVTPGEAIRLTVDTAPGADDFIYAQAAVQAPAGSEITLRLNNLTDGADEIGHNWVLVRLGQEESVLANGISAGDDRDWLDIDDPGIIGATRLIEGGERDDITFAAPPPGLYTFLCTFPEHYAAGMKGNLTIE